MATLHSRALGLSPERSSAAAEDPSGTHSSHSRSDQDLCEALCLLKGDERSESRHGAAGAKTLEDVFSLGAESDQSPDIGKDLEEQISAVLRESTTLVPFPASASTTGMGLSSASKPVFVHQASHASTAATAVTDGEASLSWCTAPAFTRQAALASFGGSLEVLPHLTITVALLISLQRARFEAKLREQALSHEAELAKHQEDKESVEATKSFFNSVRRELRDLHISEEAYTRLKQQREDKLSLHEYVVMKESLEAEKKDNELATQELKWRLSRLQADLQRQHTQLESQAQKARGFDEVHAQRNLLQEEAATLKQTNASQAEQLKILSTEKLALSQQLDSLDTEKRLLEQDKEHLEKRVETLESELRKQTAAVEDLTARLAAAKDKKRFLVQKLELEKHVNDKGLKTQADVEIQRIEGKARPELQEVRERLTEVHEKEVSLLKDRVEAANRRVEHLEQRCEAAEASYQEALIEHQNVQCQLRGEILELSAEVKMRAFENERLSLTCADTGRTKAKVALENEMMQKKLDVLREELTELQRRSAEDSARDHAELALLRERVASYEGVESEVDAALNFLTADGCDAGEREAREGNRAEAGARASPAWRRLQESLLLARKLRARNAELREAQGELRETQKRLAHLEREAFILRQAVDCQHKPQAWLQGRLRDKEIELLAAREALAEAKEALAHHQKLLEQSLVEKGQLTRELKDILDNRSLLVALKDALLEKRNRNLRREVREAHDARGSRRGLSPERCRSASGVERLYGERGRSVRGKRRALSPLLRARRQFSGKSHAVPTALLREAFFRGKMADGQAECLHGAFGSDRMRLSRRDSREGARASRGVTIFSPSAVLKAVKRERQTSLLPPTGNPLPIIIGGSEAPQGDELSLAAFALRPSKAANGAEKVEQLGRSRERGAHTTVMSSSDEAQRNASVSSAKERRKSTSLSGPRGVHTPEAASISSLALGKRSASRKRDPSVEGPKHLGHASQAFSAAWKTYGSSESLPQRAHSPLKRSQSLSDKENARVGIRVSRENPKESQTS
ncbi:hypothetical protein BESB_050350 [Besnoitia besnoiti]|uniref:Uncharacterized protein n=1 Tax=Besnoitia besnoiti TaxID=94643 RepID=A0A2A9MM49_BESBE|nr:hypothetical protein BESB_050350 [Besnoitia besnoiti]PFH36843.1 hypothetical protein BESB_050350 [Besnoitia besnoiti]